ncbi:MAG TPA: helix-turn-helix transcriptional regulator [Rhizomicrobium sp.]|nr:helix-turn-helix transcriptional regulator [Rhizomicrobium sp.]
MAVTEESGTDGFAARLDLALKALNVSRVQFAAMVGVDKSLVSRWLSSQVTPTAHNLARISDALAKVKPGFNTMQWERPLGEYQSFLGLSESAATSGAYSDAPRGPAPAGGGLILQSLQLSAREIALSGHVYTGLYVVFRQRLLNSGIPHVEVAWLYQRDGAMHYRLTDGGNRTQGHVLILRNKLHLIGEGETGRDGVTLHIINGTGDRHAMVMDGLLASVCGDRFFTPSLTKCVLLRIAHPLDDLAAEEQRFLSTQERLAAINNAGRGPEILPEEFAGALDNRSGFQREGGADWLLRVPSSDSVARSDFEAANYDFPAPALVQMLLGDAA